MTARGLILMAGLVLSALAIAAQGKPQAAAPPDPPGGDLVEAMRPSSMGPVCWVAIVESTRQIGIRCFPGENPATMAELDRANNALGAMFLERGWSPRQLEAFRRQMGEADEPTEQLCANEGAIEFYRGLASTRPDDLKVVTEEMLARPGPPQWGTCL